MDEPDRIAIAKTWDRLGMVPIFDIEKLEDGTTRRARPDEARFRPVCAAMPSKLVSQFFSVSSECSRGEYDGRPSPRDFDYLMSRDGVGSRRQLALRRLLRERNSEVDAIRARRKDK